MLYTNKMNNISITATYTDLYQISMSQVYYLEKKTNEEAVFDYFFRKIPFGGGYVVFAGLNTILEILEDFRFTDGDIDYLITLGIDKDFAEYLRTFRFNGSVYSVREGELVFPNEPILRVEGNIIEAQLVETILLNILNFQSLIATKAARMRTVAGDRVLADFGLRRAQGLGGYHATRAAIVGGFNATSNVKAGQDFGIPVVGTMAHAFIQAYDDELTAFRAFAKRRPDNCVLLVDTYDTLQSGVPNAITVAKEMAAQSKKLAGVRLDSGDLAYLSKRTRAMLDEAGLHDVKITASNQLDEFVIKSLLDQHAQIDIFGVGTSLVTGPPDAALDGVYKLSFANGKPRIKLSENIKKLTLPGRKQVLRVLNNGKFFGADVVTNAEEMDTEIMHHPQEPDKSLNLKDLKKEQIMHQVMSNGKIVQPLASLPEIASYCKQRLSILPDEHKRFQYPHIYKVGISAQLLSERNRLRNQFKKS